MTQGIDNHSTAVSLAKTYMGLCEGVGDITLPKETLLIMLNALFDGWKGQQDQRRTEYKKVAT